MVKNLQTFYLSYFIGSYICHFDHDGSRNYLILQPVLSLLEYFLLLLITFLDGSLKVVRGKYNNSSYTRQWSCSKTELY